MPDIRGRTFISGAINDRDPFQALFEWLAENGVAVVVVNLAHELSLVDRTKRLGQPTK
jgi:hypothetical protein